MKTNYRKFAALPLLVAALTVVFSCKKNAPEEPVEPTLIVSNSSAALVFSADGKTMTANGSTVSPVFTVTTNQPSWDAKSDQTWLKLSKEENHFTLSADPHTGFDDLPAAKVTVTAGDAAPVILNVTQLTPSAPEPEDTVQGFVLGHGYDATGLYAVSTEVKQAVLDFTKLVHAGMIKQDENLAGTMFYSTYRGQAADYTLDMALLAGIGSQAGVEDAGAFSGELTTRYDAKRITKDAYSFAFSSGLVVKSAWYVAGRKNPEELREYVSDAFLNDLESKTPAEIISEYGTHVILGGIWGGRCNIHFSAKKKIEAYQHDLGTSFCDKATMEAKIIIEGTGSTAEVQNRYAEYYNTATEKRTIEAWGGNAEYGRMIHDRTSYETWAASVDDNQTWCDYYPESLVPVYEFVADQAKRNALQEAFISHMAGKKIDMSSSLVLKGTSEWFERTGATIQTGDGEIDSGGEKKTFWYLSMSIEKSNADIVVHFVYQVKEDGDRTTSSFIMQKDVNIPIGRSDFIIIHEPMEWSSGEQYFVGQQTDWIEMLWDTPHLHTNYWWLRVDAPGGNDNNYVGVKGYLYINYAVLEDE